MLKLTNKFPIISNLIPLFHLRTYFSIPKQQPENNNLHLIVQRLKFHTTKSRQLQKQLIDASLSQNKIYINQQKIRSQINKLAPIVSLYDTLSAILQNITDLNQMLTQSPNPQQLILITQQLQSLHQQKNILKQQALKQLIPDDIYDNCSEIILEFRPGVGGTQSCIFVEDLSQMMTAYCQSMGWKVQVIAAMRDINLNKGYRVLNLKVNGYDVYKTLKCQSGVHKVIRVPQTQAKGRLHSSTVSMIVMPAIPFDFIINDKDIRYQYTRASGPGGQGVNKTDSACRATHIPTGLSVFNQQDRSQQRNKKRATQILKQKLFQIQYNKTTLQQQKKRKQLVGTMGRSQKIRTYNYPQNRITDHRTNLTLFGMESMMAGIYLHKFIQAYQEKMYQQKLEMLMEDLKKQGYNDDI